MRKLLTLLTAAVLLSSATFAQKISGSVKDQQGKGLEKTTVSLLKAKDSSVVKLTVSDNQGNYSFQADAGKYLISVSYVGYLPTYSKTFDVATGDVTVEAVTLLKNEGTMAGVTVTSKKPIVEVRADKTIMNVEGTINAVGQDALELLRKSPGVMVDKDDNITLAGKNGVQVFIDGKPSPLSGADLANFLKTLQSSQIEAVELITNPSAKYEAAGNAGIINIKLKKNKTFGTNGSVNAGYAIGTYGKYNAGLALNHRNAKVNLFGNYNYNRGLTVSNFKLYRAQGDSIFDQTQRMKNYNDNGHNFKAGLDYFLNAKSTVGAIVTGNLSDGRMDSKGPMDIIYRPTNEKVRLLQANSDNDLKRDNINFNLNYRYAMTGGSELNVDADYGFYKNRSNQFQPNHYYDVINGQLVPTFSNVYRMIAPTDIDIYSVKVDYEQNFKKGRLGLGGKLGYVNTDNDFQRYNVYGNSEVIDKDRSNKFTYKENVNAVYANYNRAFKGFMIQAGLRVENTNSDGRSTGLKQMTGGGYAPYDSTISRNYTDFFPSAAITFNKNPMSQFGLTYSRRIDRPVYQDLNPFEFKLNDYTYMKGNTQLRPQYTNSFGITHTYKYRLNTALNYSHVKDIFTQLPDTINKSEAYLIKKNLATQDIISLNISYPFQYKWYSFFANLNTYYSHYKANFGGGDRNINLDVFAASFYMQNTFKLSKTINAELTGFYNSPTIWQGTFKSRAIYGIDGGFTKTILKGNGTVRAVVTDMFKLLKFKGESNFTGVTNIASGNWESRQFKLNFTYRFGSNQVKAARQRKTGLDDENKRAAGQSGSPVGGQQ
ncbi:MAG: TonB-dependent receptor [Citrobacter freundii]|nr:MAG: TonB-dependent receptor [Citrobacter freundii]